MAIEMEMEMDLGTPVMTRTRTPDSDTDTPPRSTPTKRLHYSNDRHAPGVSYKECMKNHAATIGGHALDGCCEFMPGPTFNPLDPTSLKCGACGCHRNFHRRDPDDPAPLNHHPTPARRAHSPPSASQLLLSLSQSPSGPSDEVNPTAVSLGGGGACGGGSGGGGGVLVGYNGGQNGNFSSSSSRKRFRTKFSQEQKEKMYEFSEKIGWKLKKGEEKLIEDFVKEIGVGRTVFKVWMHNNKHTSSSSTSKTRGGEHNLNNNLVEEANVIAPTTTTTTTTTTGYVQQLQQQQQQQHSTSNGSKSGSSSGHVGNCGASVVVDHVNHSVNNHHHHHNRQFNFANGGGQEAAQAQ